MHIEFSLIIPVYNRPDEVQELLESLNEQTDQEFEVLIIEDGSTVKCEEVCKRYSDQLNLTYIYKPNSGPGPSRNFGMQKASGNYFIIFDSDCIIPPNYIKAVRNSLSQHYVECFGGPDTAHESFSDTQKAINYTMTSFFTTGGIRGGNERLGKFQPRSFNMGISKQVFDLVGGFSKIHPGEDPDLTFRIWEKGFDTALIKSAYVFHKRRIDFKKYGKQVYKFGVVRVILNKWHKGTGKITYWFPSVFTLGLTCLIMLSLVFPPISILPLFYFIPVFVDALIKTKNLKISLLAICTTLIQFFFYGYGFLLSQIKINLMKQHEKKAFPNFFFK